MRNRRAREAQRVPVLHVIQRIDGKRRPILNEIVFRRNRAILQLPLRVTHHPQNTTRSTRMVPQTCKHRKVRKHPPIDVTTSIPKHGREDTRKCTRHCHRRRHRQIRMRPMIQLHRLKRIHLKRKQMQIHIRMQIQLHQRRRRRDSARRKERRQNMFHQIRAKHPLL